MSANRLFLTCSFHISAEEMLCLAERPDGNAQYSSSNMKRADEWFAKHMKCGPGSDHFQLAYNRPRDWDLSPPAQNTVSGGVKLALVKGGETKQ